MDVSIAHDDDYSAQRWGQAHWEPAKPPTPLPHHSYRERVEGERTSGRMRSCSYCGSMHPADIAEAVKAGAVGHFADWKYGWPHKAYFQNVPNPHAGMMETRSFGPGDKVGDPQPAPALSSQEKFYSVHLKDASPEEREVIEKSLGLRFTFADGKVSWRPWQ